MRADTRSFVLLSVRRFMSVVNLWMCHAEEPPNKGTLLPNASLLLAKRSIQLFQLCANLGMLWIAQ